MIIQRAKDIRMTPIEEIVVNPKNRNKHSEEQIDRLCKIIEYQGFRVPLIVSNRTGLLCAGHGRMLAALKLGITELPVSFQDFDNEEQEIAAGVSDNAIALWANLDMANINVDLADLGPDFDLDMLGLENFSLDVESKTNIESEKINTQFIVAVECKGETEMQSLYEELYARGYSCKLIT